MKTLTQAWIDLLADLLATGQPVAPREQATKEILHRTVVVDARRPVLRVPARRLSYQFMAAEAYWILSGDDSVAGIAPWNKEIARFSDDGVRFFGAYGPKVIDQLPYVVDKLVKDPDTRQAGLTIWRESPPETRDPPCTIAIFFSRRGGLLNAHVFMRSSDAWLGLPYDVFNFACLAHLVCARVNAVMPLGDEFLPLRPGAVHLTAASSHLYELHWTAATEVLRGSLAGLLVDRPSTPDHWWQDEARLMSDLKALRDTKPGHALRWWEAAS